MSLKHWDENVLRVDGAAERVAEIERALRLAVSLMALREPAVTSHSELAEQLGTSPTGIVANEETKM